LSGVLTSVKTSISSNVNYRICESQRFIRYLNLSASIITFFDFASKNKKTKVNCCMSKASCTNVKQRHREYMYMYMTSYVKTSFETKG
jgi:hypothetical protein